MNFGQETKSDKGNMTSSNKADTGICNNNTTQFFHHKRFSDFYRISSFLDVKIQQNEIYLTILTFSTAFYKKQFYKNKSLDFVKKFKNKLRKKPDLLSHRAQEQSV